MSVVIMCVNVICVGGVRDVDSVKQITRATLQRTICAMLNSGEFQS